jgi:hypothetical protein
MSLHIALMAVAGGALLTAILGSAIGWWCIAPSATGHSQMLIRFGMAVAGASCVATVISTVLMGGGWRERVHWELAADAGFAVLALGLLIGPIERELLRRASRNQGHQRHAESEGD